MKLEILQMFDNKPNKILKIFSIILNQKIMQNKNSTECALSSVCALLQNIATPESPM